MKFDEEMLAKQSLPPHECFVQPLKYGRAGFSRCCLRGVDDHDEPFPARRERILLAQYLLLATVGFEMRDVKIKLRLSHA